MQSLEDLARAFAWADGAPLPSQEEREGQQFLRGGRGWPAMVERAAQVLERSAEILYPANPGLLVQDAAEKAQRKAGGESEALLATLVAMARSGQRTDMAPRIARAVLVKGLSNAAMDRLRAENKLFLSSADQERAAADLAMLQSGHPLAEITEEEEAQLRAEDPAIDALVRFILHPDNIGTASWGTRRVDLGPGEILALPRLVRRVSLPQMQMAYIAAMAGSQDRVPDDDFVKVARMLTTDQQQLLDPDDNVAGVLVHDSIAELHAVARDAAAPGAGEYRRLADALYQLQYFVLVEFQHHMRRNDNVATHESRLALDPSMHPGGLQGGCSGCSYFPFVMGELRAAVDRAPGLEPPQLTAEEAKTARSVIEECERRLVRFLGNRVRTWHQQRAVEALVDELEADARASKAPSKRAVLAMTWNRTLQRGIHWCGCVVSYFRPTADGDGVERVDAFVDSILEEAPARDAWAAASVIDAVLAKLHEELPFLQTVAIQLDLSHHQDEGLPVMLQLVNSRSPVKVSRLFHSSHSGLLAAHFARARTHLQRFMRDGLRTKIWGIATPRGLAQALAWGGGVWNSAVQLLTTNFGRRAELVELLEPLIVSFNKQASRLQPGEVFATARLHEIRLGIYGDVGSKGKVENDALIVSGTYTFRAFCFSEIGLPIEIKLHPEAAKRVLLVSDDSAAEAAVLPRAPDFITDEYVSAADPLIRLGNAKTLGDSGAVDLAEQVDPPVEADAAVAETLVVDGGDPVALRELPMDDQHPLVTGVKARLGTALDKQLSTQPGSALQRRRVDVSAWALRRAHAILAAKDTGFLMRDAASDAAAPEYEVASGTPLPQALCTSGWATGPGMDEPLRLGQWRAEIEQVLDALGPKGAGPSAKQVSDFMRRLPTGEHIMAPGEHEVRAELEALRVAAVDGALVQLRARARSHSLEASSTPGDGDGENADPHTRSDGTPSSSRKRGRPSTFTDQQEAFFQELLVDQPDIKPKAALKMFRMSFPHANAPDGTIKSKVSNLKSKKARESRNSATPSKPPPPPPPPPQPQPQSQSQPTWV